jgi:hypothetical protein
MADSNAKPKSIDELLADARRLKAQVGQTANDTKKTDIKGTVLGDTLKKVEVLNDAAQEAHGAKALIKETGKSVWHFLGRTWPVRAYGWLFKKICYKKDKETGERKLRPRRAKAMILTTAFLASAALPGMVGTPARHVIGAVSEPIYDGARMATMMHKNEIMYLNDEHVVDHAHNTWVVKGTTQPGGDVNDAVLLNVKPSLANDLWSWKNKGTPFFIPDQVVAPVAPGNQTKYMVTYYGHRWRLFTWLQAYPELLDVKALPADFNANAAKGATPPQAQTTTPAPAQQQAPAPKAPSP